MTTNSHGRNALLKLDLVVLPVTTMLYFLSFLDRSNVGNSRVAGMQKDLAISDHQYQIAITLTYVPYIIAELPSNLLLKRLGPNYMLPMMVVLWGIVTALQGTMYNYGGLIVCRLFLGFFEGGLLPGLVLYLSFFYPRRMLQFRIAIFFVATSLAGAFSGLLAAAIVNMDHLGNRRGWQWIFILEGIFTVAFGVFTFFVLPRSPGRAIFLKNEEKEALVRILEEDSVSEEAKKDQPPERFSREQFLSAFTAPHVLFLAVAFFANGTTLFGLAYFLPTVVSGLGYTDTVKVQLMTVPPYAVSTVVSLIFAIISDRLGARGIVSIISAVFAIIGYAMFLGSTRESVQYGAVIMQVTGAYLSAPTLSTWNPNNVQPYYRKATAIAFGFVMTNSGGILSTWLFPTSEQPRYRKGTIVNLALSVLIGVAAACNLAYLYSQNKRKEKASESAAIETHGGESSKTGNLEYSGPVDDRDISFKYTL